MDETAQGRSRCDVLIRGGTYLTMDPDRPIIEDGSLAVDGSRIVAIGAADELRGYDAARVIDASGRIVTPGRTDCHTHLFQTLGKGLGDGLALWPWLCDFMWRYATAITPAEAEISVILGAIQAARAGTTAVCDNHYAPTDYDTTLAAAAAIESVGLRGALARGITGELNDVGRSMNLLPELFRYRPAEELEITEACMKSRPKGSKVEVWPAPLNVIYVDQALFRDSVALARDHGVGWHTHCSEASVDPGIYLDHYGTRPVNWLDEAGLLGPGATLAHSIWLDAGEIAAIGRTRTGVSYNPVSNQYLGCGVMPLEELLAAGAVVGLGTDGSACTGMDLIEVTKHAMLVQRSANQDPERCPLETALDLVHRQGADYMGHDAGRLEAGRLADLTVLRADAAHMYPLNRVAASLTYAARASDVAITMVDGVVIYEDGRCTQIDESAVLEEADARARDLIARAGMDELRRPWQSEAPA